MKIKNEKPELNAENPFLRVLCGIDEPREMTALLKEILTPQEQHDLALRWQLMELLFEGKTQRQIASELGISLCKITRGAKVLKNPDSVSLKMIKKNK